MRRTVALAPWIFRGALGIALSRGPGDLEQATTPADLPDHLLGGWELAARDSLLARMQMSRESPRPEHMDPSILNLTSAGVCYAVPLKQTLHGHWSMVVENIKQGREVAAVTKILIAGLVRNAERAVRGAYEMWRKIGLMFRDYRFLLLENDSTDHTVKQLELIAQKDKKFMFQSHTLGLDFAQKLEKSRMVRMANLRNMLQRSIRNFVQSHDGWDLIAVYDFDLNLFSDNVVVPHMFLNMLGRPVPGINNWDMVCANSLRHLHGFLSEPIVHHDCFALRQPFNDSFNAGCEGPMWKKMFTGYELEPVHSCFGGLAVYKASKYLDCQYDPSDYDCEHVPLHKCMRQRGNEHRMFLDPLMTTVCGDGIPQRCLTRPPASQ